MYLTIRGWGVRLVGHPPLFTRVVLENSAWKRSRCVAGSVCVDGHQHSDCPARTVDNASHDSDCLACLDGLLHPHPPLFTSVAVTKREGETMSESLLTLFYRVINRLNSRAGKFTSDVL